MAGNRRCRRRRLEYDCIVAPGGNPGAIRIRFEGAEKLDVDAAGNLVLHIAGGQVVQRAPSIYQELNGTRQTIPVTITKRGKPVATLVPYAPQARTPRTLAGSILKERGNPFDTGETWDANVP